MLSVAERGEGGASSEAPTVIGDIRVSVREGGLRLGSAAQKRGRPHVCRAELPSDHWDGHFHVAKLYGMLPASVSGDARTRTPADDQTVRNVFVIGSDKKVKLIFVTR